jgi:hypothetical protein
MTEQTSDSGNFGKVLKWIGYCTAIISFLATIGGLGKIAWGRYDTNKQINALISAQTVQLQGGDYLAAWQSLEQAEKLKPESAKVKGAQLALAKRWIEDVPMQDSGQLGGFAAKLNPVITQALGQKKPGPEHADLLAEQGWIYYRQDLDAQADLNPAEPYARSSAEDPSNPYAQAMWGYWLLYSDGALDAAEKHFAAAVATHKDGDYVRRLQLSALLLHSSDECQEETVRVTNEMRKEGRAINLHTKTRIWGGYYFRLGHTEPSSARFINAVPPAEHVLTYRWLFDGADFNESNSADHAYYLAVLEEAAGQREDALANFRLVRDKLKESPGTMQTATVAAIKRLSH